MTASRQGIVHYRVPYADTDQMGVVYYGNYLTYFERSRNELMRACGLTYKEFEAKKLMLPVVHASIDYKTPARYDDELVIVAELAWQRGVRLQVNCRVTCGAVLIAEGYTVHAVVSSETRKPVRLPDDVQAVLTGNG
jgi:acyl-CoA thioester hydrolase